MVVCRRSVALSFSAMLAVAVADGANSNITVRNQLRLSTTSSPSPVGRGTGGGAQTLHQRYFLRGRCFDLAKHPLSPSDSSPYQGERIFWFTGSARNAYSGVFASLGMSVLESGPASVTRISMCLPAYCRAFFFAFPLPYGERDRRRSHDSILIASIPCAGVLIRKESTPSVLRTAPPTRGSGFSGSARTTYCGVVARFLAMLFSLPSPSGERDRRRGLNTFMATSQTTVPLTGE